MRLTKYALVLCLCFLAVFSTASAQIIGQADRAPDEVVKQFLEDWKAGNYPAMYAALSPQSQQAYAQPVFQAAYNDALRALALSDLSYTIHDVHLQGVTAAVNYDVQLISPGFGTIEDSGRIMRLVKIPGGWGVAWSTMDIVNGLAAGARLSVQSASQPRGNIYDRNDLPLVQEGGTMVALYSAKQNMTNESDCLDLLSEVLTLRRIDLQRVFDAQNIDTIFYLGETDSATDAQYATQLDTTCGVSLRVPNETRVYEGNGGAVHVTGYIGQIPADQLDDLRGRGYADGDLIGLAGVEKAYETQLRGRPEQVLRLISPGGVVLRELGGQQGSPPVSVKLTIDRNLQEVASQAMSDAYNYAAPNWAGEGISPGAGLVVLDVNSGAVLAMVSYPFFNPDVFNPESVVPDRGIVINDLFTDTRQPFTNRVTQQQFFPGSTFKIITTSATLSENVMTESSFFCDLEWDGRAKYGDTASPRFDWRKYELPDSPVKDAAGDIAPWQALAASCNPFFYEMGARLYRKGPDLLVNYARQMGLGSQTGIDVLSEVAGTLPQPTAVEQGINQAIGQDGIQVTMLQMARMVASLVNGGILYRPYLVAQVGGANGGEPGFTAAPQIVGNNGLSADVINTLRQGMCAVTTDTTIGTAYFDFYDTGYTVCGKTGTAQSGRREPYGWFVAFAPADNPQIAVAAMVEFSREGSETAAPIVRRVMDAYFNQPAYPYPEWWNTLAYVPLTIPDNGGSYTGG